MESSEEAEIRARHELQWLVTEGNAQEIMYAYSTHMQSCYYIDGIVKWAAQEHSSDDVRNFCLNLMDEWGK